MNRPDSLNDYLPLAIRPDEPLNISDDRYEDGIAGEGDHCGICGVEFLAGEVVTAVISGGTRGIKRADVESCHERTTIRYKKD